MTQYRNPGVWGPYDERKRKGRTYQGKNPWYLRVYPGTPPWRYPHYPTRALALAAKQELTKSVLDRTLISRADERVTLRQFAESVWWPA